MQRQKATTASTASTTIPIYSPLFHMLPIMMLPIMPGMMTTVDIMTGKKTVLDYLLKPILKAKQNALREK